MVPGVREGTWYLHLKGEEVPQELLTLEATSGITHQMTQIHNTGDQKPHKQRCEQLKSHTCNDFCHSRNLHLYTFNSPGFYCNKLMWSTLVIMSGYITEFRLLHFTITAGNGP